MTNLSNSIEKKSIRLIKNNFDFLRLLFASTVLLVHSTELSGFKELKVITSFLSSAIAVKAFFVVSGFLIFMSFERSKTVASFAQKRIRRIYPAYFTVIMLCAVSLIAVSSNNIRDYFSLDWIKYVFANLTFLNFLQPTLPGVFNSNKLAHVNGALWTLKIEVMFYLTVPLFVFLFRKFGHLPILIIVYSLSVVYSIFFTALAEYTNSEIYLELGRQLPGQLSYFMAGAFFYYFMPLFERRVALFLGTAASFFFINIFLPISILMPFALAAIVIFFALFLFLGDFGKYGDFSYGIYIIHFPVIQMMLHFEIFKNSGWIFLIISYLLTLFFSIILWNLIEKRFLFPSVHYSFGLSK